MGAGDGVGEGAGEGAGEGKGERRGRRRVGGRRRRIRGRGGRTRINLCFACCFPQVGPQGQAIAIQMAAEQAAQYNAYVASLTPEQRAAYDRQLMVYYQVTHGQQPQLAQYFAQPATTIQPGQTVVVAPQAGQQPTVVTSQPAPTVVIGGTQPTALPGTLQYTQPAGGVAPGQPAATGQPAEEDDGMDDEPVTIQPMIVDNPQLPGVLPPPNIAMPNPVQY